MRCIVTDGVAWSISLSVLIVSFAKTAEPIEIPFGLQTLVGPRKHVLDEGAHWRNLVNTIEPCMRGGDAGFLSNYSGDHLLFIAVILIYLTYILVEFKSSNIIYWFSIHQLTWRCRNCRFLSARLAEATKLFSE